jgi:hypothetical protein
MCSPLGEKRHMCRAQMVRPWAAATRLISAVTSPSTMSRRAFLPPSAAASACPSISTDPYW